VRAGLLLVVVLAGACEAPSQATPPAPAVAHDADDLFGEQLIPRFDLDLVPAAKAALERDPKKWVRGTFHYAGVTYADVAVRLKGNRSRRGFAGKPSFKVRFDKFTPGRTFLGQRELVLNNLVEDPTMVRETLAYRLHRELGVAAPRTGYAELWVSGERFGLYLDVEAVDEPFLAARYGDGSGTLYEGEFGCDLYPDDAPRFEQDGGDDRGHADLVSLAELAHTRPESLFGEDGPIDVARVAAYLAVSVAVGDFDGYRHGHNYRLYHDPRTDRWSLLPWGLDRTFKKRLEALDSGGLLAKRCFADTNCRAAFATALEQAAAALERLDQSGVIERWFGIIDVAARADRRKARAKSVREARAKLRAYVRARPAQLRAALACVSSDPAIAAACAPPPAPECRPLTVAGADFFLCAAPRTFSEAEADCRAQGLTLARIDDAEQNRALAAAAGRQSPERFWIGANDRNVEGELRWLGGAPVSSGFSAFAPGQPDDAACGEDCVALRGDRPGRSGGGSWSDGHCEQRRPYVCRAP
jgi:hypothetical protein